MIRNFLIMIVLLAICLGSPVPVKSAEPNISGIISYVYETNPQEIKLKIYNWEIIFTLQ